MAWNERRPIVRHLKLKTLLLSGPSLLYVIHKITVNDLRLFKQYYISNKTHPVALHFIDTIQAFIPETIKILLGVHINFAPNL